jgi:hypothetical protein
VVRRPIIVKAGGAGWLAATSVAVVAIVAIVYLVTSQGAPGPLQLTAAQEGHIAKQPQASPSQTTQTAQSVAQDGALAAQRTDPPVGHDGPADQTEAQQSQAQNLAPSAASAGKDASASAPD